MLSRVADSLYWIGRYSERIETNAYIAAMQLEHTLEYNVNDELKELEWQAIINICGYFEEYKKLYPIYNVDDCIYYLLFDRSNLNSIQSLVESVRFNLKNARDIIPIMLWETWHDIHLTVQSFSQNVSMMEISSFLNEIRSLCLTTTGIVDSLMTRDESYMFLKIGKWLERSEKTATITKKLLEQTKMYNSTFASNYALLLTNSLEDFNRRFRIDITMDTLKYLIADQKCTRSVYYGIKKIHGTIVDLQDGNYKTYTDELFKHLYDLKRLLKKDYTLKSIDEKLKWIIEIQQKCIALGPIFTKTYYLTKPILAH